MPTTTAPKPLLECVKRLQPMIGQHAGDAEKQRRLSTPVVESMREAGIFRMYAPRSLGGSEVDYRTGMEAMEEIARVDASTAWVTFIYGSAAGLLSRLGDDAVSQILGDAETTVAGAFYPPGRAVAVDGGYRLTGRWPFVSGCHHASWFIFNGAVTRDGAQQPPSGPPEMRMLAVPAAEAQIVDTWHTGGLRGTGSNDVTVTDVFVPEGWSFPLRPGGRISAHCQGPLYRFPMYGLLATGISAVALGVARAAIDALTEMAQKKTPAGRSNTLRDQPVAQSQVAKAEAALRSARSWYYEAIDDVWDTVLGGGQASREQRVDLFLACTNATRSAAYAVDLMHMTGGGTSIYASSPLDRCFRDMHAVTQHRATAPGQYETLGAMVLGLEPPNPMILL